MVWERCSRGGGGHVDTLWRVLQHGGCMRYKMMTCARDIRTYLYICGTSRLSLLHAWLCLQFHPGGRKHAFALALVGTLIYLLMHCYIGPVWLCFSCLLSSSL